MDIGMQNVQGNNKYNITNITRVQAKQNIMKFYSNSKVSRCTQVMEP